MLRVRRCHGVPVGALLRHVRRHGRGVGAGGQARAAVPLRVPDVVVGVVPRGVARGHGQLGGHVRGPPVGDDHVAREGPGHLHRHLHRHRHRGLPGRRTHVSRDAEVVQAGGGASEGVGRIRRGPGAAAAVAAAAAAALGRNRRRLWLCHQCWAVPNTVRVAEDALL